MLYTLITNERVYMYIKYVYTLDMLNAYNGYIISIYKTARPRNKVLAEYKESSHS